MRILILGGDGYLGWPTAMRFSNQGHDVHVVDDYLRRRAHREAGTDSLTAILPDLPSRVAAWRDVSGREIGVTEGDLTDWDVVHDVFATVRPDAVVHYGEMPSAPYSMKDRGHAVFTQTNNVVGTLNVLWAIRDLVPECHLVKLGTMGEYGTPDIDIPEGFFEVEYRGRRDTLPFPRQAGSWYHWSKVHGSNNIMFACRLWGLRATDVMQGVVFGTRADMTSDDPRLRTRLDFDQAFGTAVNRYCCQAVIGHPLTPFGAGHQKRGFLPLRDSMRCLTLALEHEPEAGEYRVFNQFQRVYDLSEFAELVRAAAHDMGLEAEVRHVENPRVEAEDHYYEPDHQHLFDLGYAPTLDIRGEIRTMLEDLVPHRDRIERHRDALLPDVRWNGERRAVRYLAPADADTP
jgi:UDP-sulfoquinovose synthase